MEANSSPRSRTTWAHVPPAAARRRRRPSRDTWGRWQACVAAVARGLAGAHRALDGRGAAAGAGHAEDPLSADCDCRGRGADTDGQGPTSLAHAPRLIRTERHECSARGVYLRECRPRSIAARSPRRAGLAFPPVGGERPTRRQAHPLRTRRRASCGHSARRGGHRARRRGHDGAPLWSVRGLCAGPQVAPARQGRPSRTRRERSAAPVLLPTLGERGDRAAPARGDVALEGGRRRD